MFNRSKIIRKINFFEIFLIAFFWIILFASPLLLGQYENGINWNHVLNLWRNHGILFILFLINRFILLPKLFFKNKQLLYVVCASLLIAFAVSATYVYNKNNRQIRETQLQRELIVRNRVENNRPVLHSQQRPGKIQLPIRQQPAQIPPYVNILIFLFLFLDLIPDLKYL